VTDADIAALERDARQHFMAGFNGQTFPLREVWPGAPGAAYIYEMLRRTYGMSGVELARKLPMFTQH
jgi:hypothetical protein